VSTWLTRLDSGDTAGLRVAVKDAIDVAGVPTTAGCRAVAQRATPAAADADCLSGFRRAGAAIVGKANLDELCFGTSGVNPWFGTPANPLAPGRIPGGSSSGSAVAVAAGEAELALGSDTGGSIRIPAACCGIAGLKTTWGRVPVAGVWPLAPSLDTVGPLAADVTGIIAAMALLDGSWHGVGAHAVRIGRLSVAGVDAAFDTAVDGALAATGLEVRPVSLAGWETSFETFRVLVHAEFWQQHGRFVDSPDVGSYARAGLRWGGTLDPEQVAQADAARRRWQAEFAAAFEIVDVVALPTIIGPPPLLEEHRAYPAAALTVPINVAGLPALAMPVPAGAGLPASLQLVGPAGGEELLCATGLLIEAALSAR
jgi:amidase